MGIGGLRELSLSHSDKVNAGAKPAKCTSVANEHRRVLCGVIFFQIIKLIKFTNMSDLEKKARIFSNTEGNQSSKLMREVEYDTGRYVGYLAGFKDCQKEYEEKLRWIPIEEKVPEIKKDTYQVLIEKQDGMLDLIFIHKTMLDYEVKEILIDWHKAVRWRYIFL